jgi:hypothetical protein
MRLYLLAAFLAFSATGTAMASNMPDSVTAFVASLDANGNTFNAITSYISENHEITSGFSNQSELKDTQNNMGTACHILKLVMGEDAGLNETGISSLVEKSW